MHTMLKSAPAPLSSPLQSPPYSLWSFRSVLSGVVRLMVTGEQRLKDRDTLRAMDDTRLRDVGLGQGQVYRETAKPFWRA